MSKIACALPQKELITNIQNLLQSEGINVSDDTISDALTALNSTEGIEITNENYKEHLTAIKKYLNGRKNKLDEEEEVRQIKLKLLEKTSLVSSYTGNITPDANTIFVFGSNPEGRHGAGAAKVAREQFGAIYGQGEGLQGNAYALPTKDLRVKKNNSLRSISPEQIIESIKKLYETARQNPDKQFKIAYRNTDKTSLNGYTGLEMIDMFLKAGSIPTNIVFSKEWVDTGRFNLSKNDEIKTTSKEDTVKESKKSKQKRLLEEALEAVKAVRPSLTRINTLLARRSLLVRLIPDIEKREALTSWVSNLFSDYLDLLLDDILNNYNQKNEESLTEDEIETKQAISRGTRELLKRELIDREAITYEDGSLVSIPLHIFNQIYLLIIDIPNLYFDSEGNLKNSEEDIKIIEDWIEENIVSIEDGIDNPTYYENPLSTNFLYYYEDYKGSQDKPVTMAKNYLLTIALNLVLLQDPDLFDALCQNSKEYLRNRENISINFLNTGTETTPKDIENDDDEGTTDTRSGLLLIKYKLVEPSSTMSTRIRKLLGSAYTRTKYGHYRYNKILQRVRVNPDVAYYTLVLEFAKMNKPEDFDKIADRIEEKYPWFSDIRNLLYEDTDLRNEFYSAFRNVFTKYCTINENGTIAFLNYEASIDTFIDNMIRSYEGGLIFGTAQIFNENSQCVTTNVRSIARSFGVSKDKRKLGSTKNLAFVSAQIQALRGLYESLEKDPTMTLSNSDEEKFKKSLLAIVYLNKKSERGTPLSYSLEGLLNNLGVDTSNLDLTALIPQIDQEDIDEENQESIWFKEDDEGNIVKKTATELLKEFMGDDLTLPVISSYALDRVTSIFNAAKSIVSPGQGGKISSESWEYKEGDNLLATKRSAYLSIGYALALTTEAFTSVSFRHLDITRPSYSAADKISEIFNTISNIDFNNILEIKESIQYLEDNFGKYDWFRDLTTGKWYSTILGRIHNSLLALAGEEINSKYDYGNLFNLDLLKNITYFNVLTVGGNDRLRNAIGKTKKEVLLPTLIKAFFSRPNTKGQKWGLILNPLFSDVSAMELFQFPRYDTILKDIDVKALLDDIKESQLKGESSNYLLEIIENFIPEELISSIATLIELESNRVAYFKTRTNSKSSFEKRAKLFHNFPMFNNTNFFSLLANAPSREEFFRTLTIYYLHNALSEFLLLFNESLLLELGVDIEALKLNEAKTDKIDESDEVTAEEINEDLHNTEEDKKDNKKSLNEDLLAGIQGLITYYTNYINSFTQLKSILNGDPAYYKNYLEEVKRGKLSYSGGRRIYALNEDGTRMTETCIYVKGVLTPANRLDLLEKLLKSDTRFTPTLRSIMRKELLAAYSKIDSTDGFSLRSLSSIRKIYKALGGTWTDSMERSYNRIINGSCKGEDVLNIWNQIKPFLFSHTDKKYTINKHERNEKVITLHKNSEYLMTALYSMLNTALNDSALLRGMHRFMEEHNVDVIHFDSVVKVGYDETEAFSVNEVLDSKNEDDVFNHLEAQLNSKRGENKKNMFKIIPLNDYLIMQPSDDHLIDLTVIFGSLLRNIIPADLPEDFAINIKNRDGSTITLNREESIKYYNMLIADLLLDSFREISDKFTSLEDLLKLFDEAIRGNPKYGEDVKSALTLNDNKTGFRIPFNSPNLKNKISEIILGVFKNNILRQKINGGSVVLASNIGVSDDLHVVYSKDGKTVRYLEAYMPAYLGDIYKDFLVKLIDSNGVEYWTINFEEVKDHMDKSLLDIIGYRIPTEDKYSIMPIRIKGFLPASAGSSIILPTEIITRSGTDFKQYWSL